MLCTSINDKCTCKGFIVQYYLGPNWHVFLEVYFYGDSNIGQLLSAQKLTNMHDNILHVKSLLNTFRTFLLYSLLRYTSKYTFSKLLV